MCCSHERTSAAVAAVVGVGGGKSIYHLVLIQRNQQKIDKF
jgi:hypothetical protein